jgi:hypothetical protein
MSAAAAPDPAGTCNRNIPVQWVIQTAYIDNLTMNALQSDGSAYIDGQTGVTARINVCSGTNDATLSLSSQRYYTASFAKMLAKTPYTPSYAATGQTEQEPFI